MKIDSKHYSIGTSGNQQRNCSTELMQTLHLIPKYSPLCCYCHCFELTYVCHHPSHSQRIDENPLSSGEMCPQTQQCHPTQGKKSLTPPWAPFTEFQTLQIPFSIAYLPKSTKPLLLCGLQTGLPLSSFLSAACRTSVLFSWYVSCHLLTAITTPALALLLDIMDHIIQLDKTFTFMYI